MGFYVRKTVTVGPFRFNLSKSGIGVSAGIPGFRVGTGPRRNYVQAGRGGFYYRATLPSAKSGQNHLTRAAPIAEPNGPTVPARSQTLGPDIAIASGSVLAMRDESAAGLLAELHEKRGRWQLTPVVALLVLAGTISLWGGLSNTGQILIVTAGAIVVGAVRQVDQIRKSTVVMYDLDTDGAQAFERLIDAVRGIGGGQRLWHVASHAAVIDRKYHAGAQEEIARTATSVGMGSAPFVKCNIDVPTVGVGKRTLWFFPDRLLVFDSGSVGAVAYANLTVARQPIRFIEAQGVPGDSRVVGRTWRYVNKSGGPDRRFKDNRELPICEYESLHLRSGNGLNELFHSSKTGVGDGIALLLHDLSRGSHT